FGSHGRRAGSSKRRSVVSRAIAPESLEARTLFSVPVITSLMPPSATVGGPALTLSVRGTSLLSNSTIAWNGTALFTTSASDGSGSFILSATVPVADISAMGMAQVTVITPGGGERDVSGESFYY